MKFAPELVGTYQDSEGGGGRHCPPLSNGSFSWRGSPGSSGPRQWRLRCRSARPRTFSPCATSRFVSEPPTFCAFDGERRALHIVNALVLSVAVAEIELRQIPMQMGLGNVLIGAIHAALEDRKEAFDGVSVYVAPHVFVGAV